MGDISIQILGTYVISQHSKYKKFFSPKAEERRRLENDNKAMIAEELDQMKINTEHEKAEIQVS